MGESSVEKVKTDVLELIDSPEKAETALQNLFLPEDPVELKREIERQQSEQRRTTFFLALAQMQKRWEKAQGKKDPKGQIDKILVATQAPQKIQILRDIAERFGYPIYTKSDIPKREPVKVPFKLWIDYTQGDEYEYGQLLKRFHTDCYRYPQLLAREKLVPYSDILNPVFAFDSVIVNHDGTILEKPEDMEKAREALLNLAGHPVSVVVGAAFLITPTSGERILINDGVNISFKLKPFTSEAVDSYMQKNRGSILSTSAGLNFAIPDGEEFIDLSKGVAVWSLDRQPGQKPVRLAKSALPVLKPYFEGVPSHFTTSMVKSIRPIYDAL
ncbi:MAG: hypothetical protein A2857_04405 [Candidatus Levybacteria bacterium RIFCSPHIGHO2_01_FULL_36_15]|nr:MAG: hypothetical protein A2857_04405 [Candidatus Levybacteria bacterium RIFCSPHIGHO2_01_FULL_36_15]OGH37608.1 MAG: hypothetical protein A2905_05020 [Candidatus Levybacteria bacterium RIFCSPLOWO2_01_FULL_36_10]